MNAALNAVTAPDAYTPSSTLAPGVFLDHFNIDVANQAIYWQPFVAPANGTAGMAVWGAEVYMPPGSRSITRDYLCGARFRAAIPLASLPAGGKQAVVTLEVVI